MLDNKYKFSLVFVWIDQRGKDQAKPEFHTNPENNWRHV